MRIFLKILNYFFVILGVIFFVLITLIALFFIIDPLNLRSIAGDSNAPQTNTTDKHPLLLSEQEKALEKLGIDPAILPTEVTPEMEDCFTNALGQERVNEIKQGDEPSPLDIFKARSCIGE